MILVNINFTLTVLEIFQLEDRSALRPAQQVTRPEMVKDSVNNKKSLLPVEITEKVIAVLS